MPLPSDFHLPLAWCAADAELGGRAAAGALVGHSAIVFFFFEFPAAYSVERTVFLVDLVACCALDPGASGAGISCGGMDGK